MKANRNIEDNFKDNLNTIIAEEFKKVFETVVMPHCEKVIEEIIVQMALTFKQSIEENNCKIKELEDKIEQINMQTQLYNQRPMYTYAQKPIPEEKSYSMMSGMTSNYSSEIPFGSRMNKIPMNAMEQPKPHWVGGYGMESYMPTSKVRTSHTQYYSEPSEYAYLGQIAESKRKGSEGFEHFLKSQNIDSIDSLTRNPPEDKYLFDVLIKLSYSIAKGNISDIESKLELLKAIKRILFNSMDYLRYKSDIEEVLSEWVIPKLKELGLGYFAQILYD